jgi:hypothetical protein
MANFEVYGIWYGHMAIAKRRANPIRKDVAARVPNWLPEGVVGSHPPHLVIHLVVAPRGVVYCRRRWQLL